MKLHQQGAPALPTLRAGPAWGAPCCLACKVPVPWFDLKNFVGSAIIITVQSGELRLREANKFVPRAHSSLLRGPLRCNVE